MLKISYGLKLMVIKFTSLIMQWFMLLHSLLYFSIFWFNLFYLFSGSSSTIDRIEDTFHNILDDYDDKEESVVTLMEESGDYFWRTRQFLFCYVLGARIILLCHIMKFLFLLWYCLVKPRKSITYRTSRYGQNLLY